MTVKVRPYKKTALWEVDIRFKMPDGTLVRERVRSPVKSKTGSERWGQGREAKLLRGEAVDGPESVQQVPTLAEFAKRFVGEYSIADGLKPATVNRHKMVLRRWLIPALGSVQLDELQPTHVQMLKGVWAAKKMTSGTIHVYLSTLKCLLAKALEWKVLEKMPFDFELKGRPATPNRPDFYDFEEYAALVKAAESLSSMHLLVVLMGGDAGMRSGEIRAAEWEQVGKSEIYVDRNVWEGAPPESTSLGAPIGQYSGSTKGGRGRRIPLTRRLVEALRRRRVECMRRVGDGFDPKRHALILTNKDGDQLTKSELQWIVKQTEERAKKEKTGRMHIFRHTFCSHLAMRGASARAIQELAGHADLKMTERYMHLCPGYLDSSIALLEPTEAPRAVPMPVVFGGEIMEKRLGPK